MELSKNRFTTLDVFRGMTICFMIIVNSPGAGAAPWGPLNHASWIGFTPTDLVFPSFLFAVGNALSFSKSKLKDNRAFWQKVIKRTLLIFLLGYLMYWFPFVHRSDGNWAFNPIASTRIMGVLQRIALCYFFGAVIAKFCSRRTTVAISIALLLGYWWILWAFGAPGEPYSMLGNAGTKLDNIILGHAHMYREKAGPIGFDPEGILSTMTGIVNVLAGYLAGMFIQKKGRNYEAVAKLIMTGSLIIGIALFWGQFFPIAKKLWTSSFTLLTIGIDLLIISLLLYFYEIQNKKTGINFFLVFGRNPLIIYLLSELLLVTLQIIWVRPETSVYSWVNTDFFQQIFPGSFGSLLFAICYMLLCWLVGYWMNKRKIYVRI